MSVRVRIEDGACEAVGHRAVSKRRATLSSGCFLQVSGKLGGHLCNCKRGEEMGIWVKKKEKKEEKEDLKSKEKFLDRRG